MGSYDCYCALCSGPLGIGFVKLGSQKAKAIKKRRRRVSLKKRRLAGEEVHESQDEAEVEAGGDEDEVMVDVGESEKGSVEDQPENGDGGDWSDDSDWEGGDEESEDSDSTSEDSGDEYVLDHDELNNGIIPDVSIPPPDSDDDEDSEQDETWSQDSDLSVPNDWTPYSNKDETDSMYSYDEKHTYDPEKLKPEDFKWIGRCRALGFNAQAEGVTKTFVTGRGSYDDYGDFRIRTPGNDPNDPEKDNYPCFHSYDPNEIPAFPFHEACYKTLARSLGYADAKDIDRDVLYSVFAQNVTDHDRVLDLDYGEIEGVEQFWECYQGEEFSVCDPSPKPNLQPTLQSMLPAQLFTNSTSSMNLGHKVRSDPLAVLPYDLLHTIFTHLSTKDLQSLMRASWHVCSSTRDNAFWRQMMRLHLSPWFWEVNDLLSNTTFPETFNFKGAFLWLDDITTPRFGMDGPMMGIANRRRIWQVCQQLTPQYLEKVTPDDHAEPEDEEAKALLKSAKCLHMPIVMYPQPREARTISKQFIRSWSEMHLTCNFETWWNETNSLTGIAVTFGTSRRLFGVGEGTASSGHTSFRIPPGDWIQEIRIFLSEVDMFHSNQDRSQYQSALDARPAYDATIKGMIVTLTSGTTKTVKNTSNYNKSQRSFAVLPGMHIIGLTGQIAANGVISRLGLLQAARPGEEPAESPEYTDTEKLLLDGNAAYLLSQNIQYRNQTPRENQPNFHPITVHPFYPYDSSNRTTEIPQDVLPTQILQWAQFPEQYKTLTGISCFQPSGGTASSGDRTWDVPDMIGFKPTFNWKFGSPRHVGTGGPVPAQFAEWHDAKSPRELNMFDKAKAWEDAYTVHFMIDGAGGEVVSEVHASEDMKALKLITNKGRESYFGEPDRGDNWRIKRAEPGELITGLSVCFGRLGGWSWGAKMHSHWKVDSFGVVTMRIDGNAEGE